MSNSTSDNSLQTFTCLSCQVSFQNSNLQKNHMKSDWHRYNLKRRVVELPPLSAAQFQQKLMESQPVVEEVESYCRVCKKSYSSNGALQTHLSSKKHMENVKKSELKDDDIISVHTESSSIHTASTEARDSIKVRLGKARTEEEVDQILNEKMENAVRLTPIDCLFCNNISHSIEKNLEHMAKSHSFFIPDMEFLNDIEGLLQYLADKISIGNVCLYCNGKGRAFHTLEAVRNHMFQKGHCKIFYQDGQEDEIAEFYQFSKEDGWKDIDEDMEDGGEYEELDEEEEEEDDEDGARIEGENLVLSNGKVIGHRQFKRFWKQNIRPNTIIPGSRMDPQMITHLSNNYRMIGYNYGGQLTLRERMELKIEKRERMKTVRRQNYDRMKVGVKHNMLQHHYREQNPF